MILDHNGNTLSRLQPSEAKPAGTTMRAVGNDAAFMVEQSGGRGSTASSGVQVNHRTALTYSAIYRGVSVIANTISRLPCVVYRIEDGQEIADRTHPAWYLLRHRPNTEMTALTFFQTLFAHVILWGNGFAFIRRDEAGRPAELWPLLPSNVVLRRTSDGTLYYSVVIGDTSTANTQYETINLPVENVLHFKNLGFDGLTGYDVVGLGRDSIGLGLAGEQFASRYFDNSATPSLAVQIPGRLTDKQYGRLKASWNECREGLLSAHKPLLVENDGKVETLSNSARESQLTESREFDLKSAANWTGSPVHKIGGEGRTAFASLEEENQAFRDESIEFHACSAEAELEVKLLTEPQIRTGTHSISFRREELVRSNLKMRTEHSKTALGGAPWKTRNEVRHEWKLAPVPGGDTFIDPLNMAPEGSEDQTQTERAIGEIVRTIGGYAIDEAEQNPKRFARWLELFEKRNRPLARVALPEALADDVLEAVRAALDEVYSTATREEFSQSVRDCIERLQAELPAGFNGV